MSNCEFIKSKPITINYLQNFQNYNNSENFTNKLIDQDEYCLKKNFFNPDKSSPPNNWNTRLIHRLNSKYN